MSDITATNCGCGCDDRCDNNRSGLFNMNGDNDCCSIIWIIILLSICGCGNNGIFGRSGNNDNSCIWIILLLFFCGGMGCGC